MSRLACRVECDLGSSDGGRRHKRQIKAWQAEALDRLTVLHLKQSVQLVHLEQQLGRVADAQAVLEARPDVDHTLAQLVANLADVRRRLPV